MKYLLFILSLLTSCGLSMRRVNFDASCTAECYSRYVNKEACGDKFIQGKLLGRSLEGSLICECLLRTNIEIQGSKPVETFKRIDVIMRAPRE